MRPKRAKSAQIPKNSITVMANWPRLVIANEARYWSCARSEIAT
jgi:hypothetical protein